MKWKGVQPFSTAQPKLPSPIRPRQSSSRCKGHQFVLVTKGAHEEVSGNHNKYVWLIRPDTCISAELDPSLDHQSNPWVIPLLKNSYKTYTNRRVPCDSTGFTHTHTHAHLHTKSCFGRAHHGSLQTAKELQAAKSAAVMKPGGIWAILHTA